MEPVDKTVMRHWQLQEAKQRFSELIRAVEHEGPQVVTRHGRDVAVVVDIESYRHSQRPQLDFKEFLGSMPASSPLEIERDRTPARQVDLLTR